MVVSAAVCDRSTLTLDGNVRIVWIKYQYLNCINISDVLCFFPETYRRNPDVRQHAENSNNTTPPSSTDKKHRATPRERCTAVASCSIGGCDPSSVITASLSFVVLCMCHACGVARLARAAKKKKTHLWQYGQLVTMPDFGFDGVSSSLVEFMSIFFFPTFFLYDVRTPDTTNTDSTRAVQGACYNQLATTLYTLAACLQRRKQHHTRAVVCPRCITAVASYLIQ